MRVDLFDFDLPPERIALRPAQPRDAARLLRVTPEALSDHHVRDLPDLLEPGDLLVFNDTRVIPAQLEGSRGDARIGATLIEDLGDRTWRALVRNARRLRDGETVEFGQGVHATAVGRDGEGAIHLRFQGDEPVPDLIARAGRMPLPPYIAARRPADEQDATDYQTLFAAEPGAVAAPTAALHFTPDLMARLAERGIDHAIVTLHVGPGTFLPVKAEDTADHRMHAERGRVGEQAAAKINTCTGRVIAVGTTSLRLLECAADEAGAVHRYEGATDIFITPGHRFRAVDGLLTNFHLPRSTLMMLVSALMGRERMMAAYAHAIASEYRFYSYGDASLLLP